MLSQNVQGMNGEFKAQVIRHYYHRHMAHVDVICFQETKLRGDKLLGAQNIMWRGADFHGVEAKLAYNHDYILNGAGSGGLYMWTSPKVAHLI